MASFGRPQRVQLSCNVLYARQSRIRSSNQLPRVAEVSPQLPTCITLEEAGRTMSAPGAQKRLSQNLPNDALDRSVIRSAVKVSCKHCNAQSSKKS